MMTECTAHPQVKKHHYFYAIRWLGKQRVQLCGELDQDNKGIVHLRLLQPNRASLLSVLAVWPQSAGLCLRVTPGGDVAVRSWSARLAFPIEPAETDVTVLHLRLNIDGFEDHADLLLPVPIGTAAFKAQVHRCRAFDLRGTPLFCLCSCDPNLGVGGNTWGASRLLVSHMHCHAKELLVGKSCLELGSGTGLLGLAAARLGAAAVLLTDLDALVPLLRLNIELEHRQGCNTSKLSCAPLPWGNVEAEQAAIAWLVAQAAAPDVVLLGECIYQPRVYSDLLDTLRRLAPCSATRHPLFLLGHRGAGAVVLHPFFREAARDFDWLEVDEEVEEATSFLHESMGDQGDASDQGDARDKCDDHFLLLYMWRRAQPLGEEELEAMLRDVATPKVPHMQNLAIVVYEPP